MSVGPNPGQPAPATFVPYAGTYTPTITGGVNVSAVTPSSCVWTLIGTFCTVTGSFALDPTAGATLTKALISLPFPSAFVASSNGAGVAATSAVAGYSGALAADPATGQAQFAFTTAADVANQTWAFCFTYQVL